MEPTFQDNLWLHTDVYCIYNKTVIESAIVNYFFLYFLEWVSWEGWEHYESDLLRIEDIYLEKWETAINEFNEAFETNINILHQCGFM